MSTPASTIPRRGNPARAGDYPTPEEVAKASKSGGARKLDVLSLDQLWDELQSLNRAAGPWGIASLTGRRA